MSFLLKGRFKGKKSSLSNNWRTCWLPQRFDWEPPYLWAFHSKVVLLQAPRFHQSTWRVSKSDPFYLSPSRFLSITALTESAEIIRPSFIFFKTHFLQKKDTPFVLYIFVPKISERPVICPFLSILATISHYIGWSIWQTPDLDVMRNGSNQNIPRAPYWREKATQTTSGMQLLKVLQKTINTTNSIFIFLPYFFSPSFCKGYVKIILAARENLREITANDTFGHEI